MRRALLCLAICATACSYPDFAFVSDDAGASGQDSTTTDVASDGVAHDTSDSTLTDSTSETIDSAIVDTGVDSAIDDSGFDVRDTLDTAPDAPLDAVVTHGCAGSTALFCDDYDTSSTAWSLFDGTNVLGAGTIELDTTFVVSSPSSFLSTLGVASVESSASMDKQFTAPTPGAFCVLDVWIRVEVGSDPDGIELFKIQGFGTGGKGVGLLLDSTGLDVETVGSPGTDYPVGVAVPTGRFVHYRMMADLVMTAAHVTLWMDDMTTPVLDRTDASTAPSTPVSQYVVIVGAYSNVSVTTDFHARFDDVTFDFP